MEIRKKTVCPLDCPDSCGMIAIVRQGKVTALQGDPDHPFTAGFVCRKMRRYPERLNSPDRLLHPLRRVGRKGAGDFVRIGWEEAWQILTEQLQQTVNRYGGEAILPYHYGGNMGLLHRFAGHSLFYRLGASRLEETICSAAASSGWQLHCGKTPSSPPGNVVEADLVVVWGCNLKVTNVHFWRLVVQARSRGAHLVVIDPYRTATAASADTHLQVRPGGDHALALGLIKVLLEKDWIDHSFIREQTRGFELLVELLAETSWEQLVDTCGISRSQMEELARLFSIHPRTFLRIGIGLSRNSHGGAAIRGIASLAAVLGLFDTSPGRGLFLTSGAFHGRKEKLTYPTLGPAAGRLVNMNRLGEALTLLDPPVRLLFVYNANPLSSAPDSSQVRAGLKREDLFTVVHEQVMSPTARYADLVLPATTFLENRDLYTAYGHFHLALVDPAIPPMGEAISNFQLFQTLAGKLGFDDPLFCQSLDQRLADYLQDLEGLPQGWGIRCLRENGSAPPGLFPRDRSWSRITLFVLLRQEIHLCSP